MLKLDYRAPGAWRARRKLGASRVSKYRSPSGEACLKGGLAARGAETELSSLSPWGRSESRQYASGVARGEAQHAGLQG